MEKLINQDWTNPFTKCKIGEDYYGIIAAGEGVKNVNMPDGTILDASDVKRDLGYPQLFAWNLEGKALLEWVEYLDKNPDCPCKLVVDSGAYSMWSRGKEFDMDEYIDAKKNIFKYQDENGIVVLNYDNDITNRIESDREIRYFSRYNKTNCFYTIDGKIYFNETDL